MKAIPLRVVRLVPLLASTIDGEALGTRDAIVRTLAAVGLDMNDLAAAICVECEPKPRGSNQLTRPHFFDMARACRDLDCGRLSPAEKQFVGDMCRAGSRSPSARQSEWLGSIFDRLNGRFAA